MMRGMTPPRDVLVTLANTEFLPQAKQLFASAYAAGAWRGDFLLLACGVPKPRLKWFTERGIHVHAVSPLYTEREWAKYRNEHPPIITAKFHLFTPHFRRWRTVIFMDADIIVREPIAALAEVTGFSASIDHGNTLRKQMRTSEGSPGEDFFGYRLDARAFNSGVMAFPSSIITDGMFAEMKALCDEHVAASPYVEQFILNLYFCDHWHDVSTNYNTFVYECPKTVPVVHPLITLAAKILYPPGAVLNFPAGLKPWDPDSSYYPLWKQNLALAEHLFAARGGATYPPRRSRRQAG